MKSWSNCFVEIQTLHRLGSGMTNVIFRCKGTWDSAKIMLQIFFFCNSNEFCKFEWCEESQSGSFTCQECFLDVGKNYKYPELAMEALKKNTNNVQQCLSFLGVNTNGVVEMADLNRPDLDGHD